MINATSLKCVFVGDDDVGKTSLVMTLSKGQKGYKLELEGDQLPLVAWEKTVLVNVDSKQYAVTLWDTVGHPDHDRIRPLGYADAGMFVLCFAMNSLPSLENIREKWHADVRHVMMDARILLVGTKSDLKDNSVPPEEIKKMTEEIGAFEFVECSTKESESIENVLHEAVKAARARPKKFTLKNLMKVLKRSAWGGK